MQLGNVSLSDTVFDAKFNESLVHQAVTAYLAGGRAGTVKQKNRSDVRGGGEATNKSSIRKCIAPRCVRFSPS